MQRDAYRLFLIVRGASALFGGLRGSATLVYQVEVVRLNPLQLVLVGTVLESVYFLCQVPTGLIADVYSRRFSVIVGYMLTGVAFMLEGAIPRFEAVLAAQILWAIGAACIDGAEEAWIAGEIGEDRVGPVFLRGAQLRQIGGVAGVLAGMGLGSIRVNLPIIVGGALFVALAMGLAFTMSEPAFRSSPREHRTSWEALWATLRHGGRLVHGQPLLLSILAVSAFYGMSSEGFDRLWTAHFLGDFRFPSAIHAKPIVWIGAIAVGSRLLAIAASELVRRRVNLSRHLTVARTLFAMNAVRIVATIGFGLAPNLSLALLAFWTAAALRETGDPIYSAWLTRSIDSKVRATVISMGSQLDAIGQIAGGPVIGVIGTFNSLRSAMVAAGIVLAPALPLFARAGRQGEALVVAVPSEETTASKI